MSTTCPKSLSLVITGEWQEYYLGPLRHPGMMGGTWGVTPGVPNYKCAPHTAIISGSSLAVHAVCNYPMVHPVNWTSQCHGCAQVDTGTFEYAATFNFTANIPGTCNVHWDVDIIGRMHGTPPFPIPYYQPGCAQPTGMYGSAMCWLDTYQGGIPVDTQFRDASSDFFNPIVHTVDSVDISRHLNAGNSLMYLFQIWAQSPLNSVQDVSALFTFTPDP